MRQAARDPAIGGGVPPNDLREINCSIFGSKIDVIARAQGDHAWVESPLTIAGDEVGEEFG